MRSVPIPVNTFPVDITVEIPPLSAVIEICEMAFGKLKVSKIASAVKSREDPNNVFVCFTD